MTACLGHPAHPFLFCTEQVACFVDYCIPVGNPFFAFGQIIGVVAGVREQAEFVNFDNLIAYPVQKVTVMCDHEQRAICFSQVIFQPFGHFNVQVVGRFVKNQKFGIADEDFCQTNPFFLSSR